MKMLFVEILGFKKHLTFFYQEKEENIDRSCKKNQVLSINKATMFLHAKYAENQQLMIYVFN